VLSVEEEEEEEEEEEAVFVLFLECACHYVLVLWNFAQ